MTLTQNQLHILQHSLGLDSHGQPPEHRRSCADDDFPGCYRNYFNAADGHHDWNDLLALVSLGYMMQRPTHECSGSHYFHVLQPGYDAVKTESPAQAQPCQTALAAIQGMARGD